MNPEKVLEEIEKSSKNYFLPIIGSEKGSVLEKLIKENQPKSVLEIGTLVGYSAILMAKNLAKGKIISLEIDPKAAEAARENIEKAGFSEKVEVIAGDAKKIIPKLKEKFDLVFIDAAKEEYIEYLKLAEPRLNKNAVIVADNAKIFAEEMRDYLNYVRNSGRFESKFYDFGFDGVEVSIAKNI